MARKSVNGGMLIQTVMLIFFTSFLLTFLAQSVRSFQSFTHQNYLRLKVFSLGLSGFALAKDQFNLIPLRVSEFDKNRLYAQKLLGFSPQLPLDGDIYLFKNQTHLFCIAEFEKARVILKARYEVLETSIQILPVQQLQ